MWIQESEEGRIETTWDCKEKTREVLAGVDVVKA